jgi:hypothetical protein
MHSLVVQMSTLFSLSSTVLFPGFRSTGEQFIKDKMPKKTRADRFMFDFI